MVHKVEVIRARLQKLEEVVSGLERLLSVESSDPRERFRDTWARERGLQLAAEILFDVGNHILSASFGITAEGYEDIILQLGKVGVIDEELCRRLKGLGGFRNIVVHDYLRLDPEKVAELLADAPRDFGDFALAVRHWMTCADES